MEESCDSGQGPGLDYWAKRGKSPPHPERTVGEIEGMSQTRDQGLFRASLANPSLKGLRRSSEVPSEGVVSPSFLGVPLGRRSFLESRESRFPVLGLPNQNQ